MSKRVYLNSLLWPKLRINVDEHDGNIPSSRVKGWKQFISLVNDGSFSSGGDEVLFRGQRNGSWALTPSIARLSEKGIYTAKQAQEQLNNFKYSVRGRTKLPIAHFESDNDVWALGQHYGLWTPLLDWSRSPFVAMFFALSDADPKDERQRNYSMILPSTSRHVFKRLV